MSVVLDVSGRPVDTLPYFSNCPFVAVAGGTGFIGVHVVQALLDQGHKVVCISRGNRRSGSDLQDNSLFNNNGAKHDTTIYSNNVIYLDYDLSSSALTTTIVESLRNCVAIVNLIGIKMEKQQSFQTAHVEVVKRLIDITKRVNKEKEIIKRFIQVSVLCARADPTSGYHDTKLKAEELLKESAMPYTILRPSVVYGRGDDMVTSLAGVIRTSPLFPLIGNGTSLHQPIYVNDLAEALVACLNHDNTIGKSYELVGPTKVTTREMVHIVADGMGLPTYSFAFPLAFHKMAADVGTKFLANPPATPTQLKMLVEGMTGDSSLLRTDLDMPKLCTTVLSPNVIQQFESQIPPISGFSLRLLSSQSHYAWLESYSHLVYKSAIILVASLLLAFACSFFGSFGSVALFYIVIGASLIYIMKPHLKWRIEMVQPPPPNVRLYHAALGLVFSLSLCIFIRYFLPLELSGWGDIAKTWRSWKSFLFVFLFAIPTDEILWSATIAVPFLARVACGKIEKEKDGFAIETNPVHRGLGYSVAIVFAIAYGIFLSLLLKIPLLSPSYGIIIGGLLGLASCALVVKTEKLIAGMICKAFMWIVMLLWIDG